LCGRGHDRPQLMRKSLGSNNQAPTMPRLNPKLAQKQRELIQFEAFRSSAGVVPDCSVDQPPEPEPDIVLRCADGQIGIELTAIHPSGVGKRLREGEQDILVDAARELYSRAGLPPVNVHIEWTDSIDLSKAQRRRAAGLLRDVVAQNVPSERELSREIGDGEGLIHPELPIRALAVSRASGEGGLDWRDWNFHEVRPPDPEEIQERLRREEPKLDLSRSAYTSRWLVLVAGSAGPSTWTVPGAALSGVSFRSRYDRVFICMVDRRKTIELPIQLDEES
jgi:hypothetical protein